MRSVFGLRRFVSTASRDGLRAGTAALGRRLGSSLAMRLRCGRAAFSTQSAPQPPKDDKTKDQAAGSGASNATDPAAAKRTTTLLYGVLGLSLGGAALAYGALNQLQSKSVEGGNPNPNRSLNPLKVALAGVTTHAPTYQSPEDLRKRMEFVNAFAPAAPATPTPTATATAGAPAEPLSFGEQMAAADAIERDDAQPIDRRFAALITGLQNALCGQVEVLERSVASEARFAEERAVVPAGPGRTVYKITRVLQDGAVFDKAGCSITCSRSLFPASIQYIEDKLKLFPELQPVLEGVRKYNAAVAAAGGPGSAEAAKIVAPNFPFTTAALSLVFHPNNPHAPTVHMNIRYFEVDVGGGKKVWWFGGGSDLTPKYLYDEDATHFHNALAAASDAYDRAYYPAFKKWADTYFFLPNRQERRGIGGMFFDNLSSVSAASGSANLGAGKTPSQLVNFVGAQARALLPAYFPLVQRRRDTPVTAEQVQWQRLRHGRYVEFNLLYDAGTKYGFQNSAAATEAILMSLPRDAVYRYKFVPKPNSPEQRIQNELTAKVPREWRTPATATAATSTASTSAPTK